MTSATRTRASTVGHLASGLWSLVLLRGVVAAALGVSLLTAPSTTASAVVTRLAAYWVVDGGLVIWAAAIARRHGVGGWGLLARGMVVALVGLWILGSPVTDVLGGRYQPGWFISFLVMVPALLLLVTVQGVFAAVMDFFVWLSVRRELKADWAGIVSAALAGATSLLLWRAILGVAHPYLAGILTIVAGASLVVSAFYWRGARPAE